MKKFFVCRSQVINILITCVLLVSLIPITSFANTSSSFYKTPTINGYNYSFTSEVWDRYNPNGGGYTAEAVSAIKADDNVPEGYMGGQARLYNSSGALEASSSWTYNTSKISLIWVYSPRISTDGKYYAQNKAEFYNGDGYDRYTGYKSPILTLSSSSSLKATKTYEGINSFMLQTKYAVNSRGETYGSSLSEYAIGVEPDLISAIGTNGIEGYVKADDLSPTYSSTEEAIEQNGKNGDIRTIPLYDVDGTTILGEFELITNYEAESYTN